MPGVLVLALHARRYWPFIADDALISLRYSARLLAGAGLTWTDGAPVEGYSNLLWVLGCAALGALSIDLVDASRLLGGLAMTCTLTCVAAWEREAGWPGRVGGALAAVAVALVGSIAVWTIGGLEQPLVAGLLALALLLARPLASAATEARTWPASIALGLLCLTRPDGAYLAALVGLGVIFARGPSPRSVRVALRLGAASFVAVAGQLAFRLVYYGDFVPNTARAKIALSAERLDSGWQYLADAAVWSWPLLALGLLAFVRPRRALWLPALPLLGWLAYVVFIGGDIFPARRHLVPAVVCTGFLVTSALTELSRARAWLGVLVAACALAWQGRLSQQDPENQRAITERWEWEGEVVGRLLGTAFEREQPLLAVDPAGCVPYFSELPALDLLGLNDRYLATHPPADFGRGWLGHELGDGEYVWSQRPDLILLCGPQGSAQGCFRSGRELLARPDFRSAYQLVTFEGREPFTVRSEIWVRHDGRLGARREGEALVVPGFFLRGRGVVAGLDDQGRIGASLPPDASATLRVPDDAGAGSASAVGDGVTSTELTRGRVVVHAGPTGAHVRALRLLPP